MAIVNITVENDSDFYREFQYVTASGVPIDITGGSLEMMLRRQAHDRAAVLRLGSDTGEFVITDALLGKFTLLITHVVLQELGLGEFAQSNIMTHGGLKKKLWSGSFINNAGATR